MGSINKPEGPSFLAFDLGAESGRLMLGELGENKLRLSELHRFTNRPVKLPGGLFWDVLHLWNEIKTGLQIAAQMRDKQLAGIGLDTWGVDFALLDQQGNLLGNPYHYRDGRTDGILDLVFSKTPANTIFKKTGNQFLQINTLFQLAAMRKNNPALLDQAQRLLMMPDLFNYWLSGQMVSEFTIATTSQCFNPRLNQWAGDLLSDLNIPANIFCPVIQPGAVLGPLSNELEKELGINSISVIAPACHDTASAVAVLPVEKDPVVWISCGTWSIVGVTVPQPVITPQTLEYHFTNEGGVGGQWQLSQNIMGLWLLQECKRSWEGQGTPLSYDDLTRLALEAKPFKAVINPDADDFLKPGDMPQRIIDFCRKSAQPIPETRGEMIRIILESIALKYRWTIDKMEEILNTRFNRIHMIGGGIKNHLLCQLTADACQRECRAGPVEATAIGNIMMQAVGLNYLDSISQARILVNQSFTQTVYHPNPDSRWENNYFKLITILQKG